MRFALSFLDFGLWLGANAIILLTASGVLGSHHGMRFGIDRKNLRKVACIMGLLFAIFVVFEAYHRSMAFQP